MLRVLCRRVEYNQTIFRPVTAGMYAVDLNMQRAVGCVLQTSRPRTLVSGEDNAKAALLLWQEWFKSPDVHVGVATTKTELPTKFKSRIQHLLKSR